MEQRRPAAGALARESGKAKYTENRELAAELDARARDPLDRYLDDLQGCRLLGPAQEIAIAERIEQLEIEHFKALLSYEPALDTLVTALAAHFEVPREVRALYGSRAEARALASGSRAEARASTRKPARAGRGADARARRERALTLAAERLRALDVARVALADADAAVRQAFAGKPGSVRYLQRVAKARAAQQAVKNQFMTANLRLVVSLARRYKQGLMPLADLIQEGNLGLMRAVERFDHRRGFRFSTYAGWWIRHGFNRALSDKARLVRVPVHLLDDAQRAARASAEVLARTGRAATREELAHETGLPDEKLAYLEQHPLNPKPASLDRKLGPDSDATLLDTLAPPDEREAEAALDEARWPEELHGLMGVLTPMEAAILRFRFGLEDGEELTLQEVGAKYNLSRERIRQLQEQALDKLRGELARREEETQDSAA